MITAAELYDPAPDGIGGVTLRMRQPIRTTDARTCDPPGLPLFRPGDAIHLPSARARGQTRDSAIPAQGPVVVMSPGGTSQSGTMVGTNFYADPDPLFSLGKVWDAEALQDLQGSLEVLLAKVRAANLMAGAKDNAACDVPPSETKDARSRPRAGNRLLAGVRSALFDYTRTRDYGAGLIKSREPQAPTPPGKTATAADYARNLAAGRAAKA